MLVAGNAAASRPLPMARSTPPRLSASRTVVVGLSSWR